VRLKLFVSFLAIATIAWLVWRFAPARSVSSTAAGTVRGGGAVSAIVLKPGVLVPRAIGLPADPSQPAWITDLTIADLDGDGLKDVIACDARANRVVWLRQVRPGEFVEQPIGEAIAGPAHVSVVDFDGDGRLDVLVAAMGVVFPNNDKIGAVVILHHEGDGRFTNQVVLEKTYRVTDVQAADLNGDGRPDLAVAQFGYLQGQVQWLENLGERRFAERSLLPLPGAIHAPIVDFNRDGRPDIVSLVAQDWEEVWLFENRGAGRFENRVLHGSVNKDFGSSGLAVADVDGDGAPDIVYTNGDGFDYATPGSRPWHGVQWLRNDGKGGVQAQRIGDFAGAYSPCVVDLNGDGANDIVVASGFNDWRKPDAVALLCFENDGQQRFTPRVLAHAPTHLIVVKAADMIDDSRPELVTGSFGFYPPFERAARITLWEWSP
jgi:hypothetical protein